MLSLSYNSWKGPGASPSLAGYCTELGLLRISLYVLPAVGVVMQAAKPPQKVLLASQDLHLLAQGTVPLAAQRIFSRAMWQSGMGLEGDAKVLAAFENNCALCSVTQ